jgi:hypothetical protein
MVEKEIDEISGMERLRKQDEDGIKSGKIEDRIGKVGRGRGRWMIESGNVEADGEGLRSLDGAHGISAYVVGRSRYVEYGEVQEG